MSIGVNQVAIGSKHFIGHCLQTAWNTEADPVGSPAALNGSCLRGYVYMPAHTGSGKKTQPKAFSKQLYGGERYYGRNANKLAEISIPCDYREEGFEPFLITAFEVTSTIITGWVVAAGVNDKVDFFDVEAALQYNGTIAAGSYNSTTYAAAVALAMNNTASAKTFTVTYNATGVNAGKWTITANAGTFRFLWATGTNIATNAAEDLGFLAIDTGNAIAHTGTLQSKEMYRHVFTYPDDGSYPDVSAVTNEFGVTVLDNKDIQIWELLSCFLTSLSLAVGENDPFVVSTWNLQGASRVPLAQGEFVPAFGTLKPATPDGRLTIAVTCEDGADQETFTAEASSLNLNCGTVPIQMKHSITSTTAKTAIKNGKFIYDGSFTFSYHSANAQFSKWISSWDDDVTGQVEVTLLGDFVRNGVRRKTIWLNRGVAIKGEDPQVASPGAIDQVFAWDGQYDTENSQPGFVLTIENTNRIY